MQKLEMTALGLKRDARGKHPFEDAAMEVVKAIRRDYMPEMDDNDGGQILCWLTELCDAVASAALLGNRPLQEFVERKADA